jgi:uncharacterized protein (TIGR02453 family)
MIFNGFSKKGIEFLHNLSSNNTKIWFEDNRHIWEEEIKNITESYVNEMGETLQILVPTISFKPKVGGSLFKIYRDVRFSKDKTPMKSKIGILFWQGTGHRMQSSSFYMHFDKDIYFIASGIRNFKPPMLKTYREYIKKDKYAKELHNILENIKSKGYNLPEYKFKRYPRDFSKENKYHYLALYGAMFAFKQYQIDDIFYSEKILDRVFKIYDDLKDLQSWVYNMTLTHTEDK